jgi:hypothetical protein
MDNNEELIKSIIAKSEGIFTDAEIEFLKKLTSSSYIKPFLMYDKAIEDGYTAMQTPMNLDDTDKVRITYLKELKDIADNREYCKKKMTEKDEIEAEKIKTTSKANNVAI